MRLIHKILFAAVCAIAPLTAKATVIQFDDGTNELLFNRCIIINMI